MAWINLRSTAVCSYTWATKAPDTHRLLLMNAMLHGIESNLSLGDTLSPTGSRLAKADVILTNPPFGTKRGGGRPTREDFTYVTGNKQLGFLQHIYRGLKPGGRAAVVLPDNVLFEEGTQLPHVSSNDIESAIIPLPPLDEQVAIVKSVSQWLRTIDEVKILLAKSEFDLTQLDQSILAKAFRGELVPQDTNDEPASVLLERIRTSREAAVAKKPSKRKDATDGKK